MDLTPAAPWVVVVPLKAGTTVKSRLREFSAPQRTELARAFAEDCVRAALDTDGVAAVLVVTDDEAAAARLDRIGCSVVRDLPAEGLNAAVLHGTRVARARWPDCWVAVLHSDVAALRSTDLAQALAEAEEHERAFVPDITGRGTNLLTAAPGVPLLPQFEGASSEAHRASGAALLQSDVPSVRCDVDDAASFRAARSLGVGAATSAALRTMPAP